MPQASVTQQRLSKTSKTPYEFFCRMMEIYADYDRSQLAVQMNMKSDDPRIAGMSDQQLREYISEQIALQVAERLINGFGFAEMAA